MAATDSRRANRLLFFLFFCGLVLTVLAFIDLQWTHVVLKELR